MIPLLVPDLPSSEQLLPWLQRIDKQKWYTNFGPLVQAFESQLIQYLSQEQSVHLTTVSSGTMALELALLALSLPEKGKALLPALTFPATATAIKRVNLQPIFTDIDPHTWMLTPKIARQVLNKISIDVVVPVATFGCPQPTEEWDQFSEDTGIPVLIDAAAAFGSQTIGRRCIMTFSFHATKPFGIGEGGLVIANSPELINQIKQLSNFGFSHGMIHQSGSNAKLSEYHAAIGLAQRERWPQLIKQYQQVWHTYHHYLPIKEKQINLQPVPKNHIPAIFPIKIQINNNLSTLIEQFTNQGIQTRRWYYPPLYKHPAFSDTPLIAPDESDYLAETEKLSQCLLGLPFHTSLQEQQIAYICEVLAKA